jgi:hypothetical protein
MGCNIGKYIMKTSVQIQAIYIAPAAGSPMEAKDQVELIPGLGIVGDRYALGTGAFSQNQPPKIRHISLIAQTGIAIANEWLEAGEEPTFLDSETRRNIVLSNISPDDLNKLVGKSFLLGGVACKGTELCRPCQRPAGLLNKSDFMNAFEGRGGLRAEVLDTGIIKIGDTLIPSEEVSK